MRPDLFEQTDLLEWLRAELAARRESGEGPSLRELGRRMGISPGYLSNLVQGQRPITVEVATRIACELGFDDEAARYVKALTDHHLATTDAGRAAAKVELEGIRRFNDARRLSGAHSDYMEKWYTAVVREMTKMPGYQPDPAWIVPRIRPRISEQEALEALEVIRARRLEGYEVLSTGHEPPREVAVLCRKGLIDQAATVFERVPRPERLVTVVLSAVSPAAVERLREELKQFNERLIAICEAEDGPRERVMVVQAQLFPLASDGGASE